LKLPGGDSSPAAERLGRRAAWVLFTVAAAAELVGACWRGRPGELGRQADLFVLDALMVPVGSAVVIVVHFALPKPARHAFHDAALLGGGVLALLWGVTCGVVGAVR
jgi:hypothetical protein